ncbi:MAG: type III pantothenate kinase, partial [Nitrospinota bacterium]
VVPPLTEVILQFTEKYLTLSPLIVGPGIKTGLPIQYDNPKEVGADRVVNAVAAIEKYGTPTIIIDFGTATTFDAVSQNGEYLGGAIAPGIGISLEALYARASKLSSIDLKIPESVIGRNTVSSIQAGTVFGYAGLIDGVVERMKKELGQDARVVTTGGLAKLLSPASSQLGIIDEMLTLTGLRLLFDRNRK